MRRSNNESLITVIQSLQSDHVRNILRKETGSPTSPFTAADANLLFVIQYPSVIDLNVTIFAICNGTAMLFPGTCLVMASVSGLLEYRE